MLNLTKSASVVDAIRSASASTESQFLDLGSRLGTAADTIKTLTQTFDVLASELRGDNLRDATSELSQIMARVGVLARAHEVERDALGQLAKLTTTIQQRVLQMGKAVNGIGMLAINARIEAVSIGDAGLDFAGFTAVIGDTLQLAQLSLSQFTGELGGLGDQLRAAAANQLTLSKQQDAAMQSIPSRLAASVRAINDRRDHSVAAASAVAQKSRQVGQRISNAVMALQIGDTTRQRLEHIEYALGIIAEVEEPWQAGKASKHGDWTALSASQRRALGALCRRMQAAQLLNAADEFDREMQQILASMRDLAADAQEILKLSNAAAGASDVQRGTFLGKVDEQVAEVSALLDGLGTARREADEVAASVTAKTTRLVGHTNTLWSLEEDIRIMGLNTTLKCGRLGASGRPLIVIAQELRSYANQIAIEAHAVSAGLGLVVTIAGSLSGSEQEKRMADLTDVGDRMANSVARLTSAGGSLADALGTLARDTEGVAELLRQTAARATEYEALGQVLRQAASEITNAVVDDDSHTEIPAPEADRVLELLVRSYTMDKERIVHDRHSNGRASAMASAVPTQTTSADFEDIFL